MTIKRITHQKVFIDHDTQMCLRHEAVRVEDAEDGDGRSQEDAEHLGDEVSDETELFTENGQNGEKQVLEVSDLVD